MSSSSLLSKKDVAEVLFVESVEEECVLFFLRVEFLFTVSLLGGESDGIDDATEPGGLLSLVWENSSKKNISSVLLALDVISFHVGKEASAHSAASVSYALLHLVADWMLMSSKALLKRWSEKG